jgi:Family of unknown function (DUF5681)
MATSKPPKPPGQHDIGYGKPPTNGQFKPGQSGNPAGGRNGQPTPQETVVREGARLVKIKRGDTVESITKHEAIIRRLYQSAMEEDIAAARLLLSWRAQSAPDRYERPAEDETSNPALSVTPDDEALRRMVARFAHLQPKEEEAES